MLSEMMTAASSRTDQSKFAVAVPAEWAVTAPPTNPPVCSRPSQRMSCGMLCVHDALPRWL